MKPITPQEAKEKKIELLPDFVIEAVNELIVEAMENHKTNFSIAQKKVIERIKSKMPEGTEWSQSFLDFEPVYNKNG